nr:MAG TPA: hypothetical protein [Caudoviricetes sp.]
MVNILIKVNLYDNRDFSVILSVHNLIVSIYPCTLWGF